MYEKVRYYFVRNLYKYDNILKNGFFFSDQNYVRRKNLAPHLEKITILTKLRINLQQMLNLNFNKSNYEN